MELKEILAWIDERKVALDGPSDSEIEKRAKCPSLIQNIRKTLKNGHGSLPKASSLAALAKVLGNPPAGLLEPLSPLSGHPKQSDDPAIIELRAKQAEYRQKEIKYKELADAIEVSIAILEERTEPARRRAR